MFATIRSARTLLYTALPYDVLDGAYFETVELPEGPLTDIHVSSGERSSDYFNVSSSGYVSTKMSICTHIA